MKTKFEKTKAWFFKTFEERPLETIAVLSGAAMAVSKLMSSVTAASNSRTWKKEVDRRRKKD